MRSCQFVLLFVSVAWSMPLTSSAHVGYGSTAKQLRADLQGKWYSEADATTPAGQGASTGALTPPSDPAGFYSCVGPKASDFPGREKWLSFGQLWTINQPVITAVNGGGTYNDALKNAILEVASESKVDARLILVLIMQEVRTPPSFTAQSYTRTPCPQSSGRLTTPCTEGTACGILQHRGSAPFSPTPDPKSSIKTMIQDGIYGTASVPGYLSYFNGAASELGWVNTGLIGGNPYAAAHVYNTGHIENENLAVDGGKANYYAHDVLSRLGGWNGWSGGCQKSRACSGLGFQSRPCW